MRSHATILAAVFLLTAAPAATRAQISACLSCVRDEVKHSFRIDNHPVFDAEQEIAEGCGAVEFQPPVFKVSADGTASSTFEVQRVAEGTCENTLIVPRPYFLSDFFVVLSAEEADPDFYGELEILEQQDDFVRFRYTHPTIPPPNGEIFRLVRIAIVYINPDDPGQPHTASWLDVRVHRYPVLMVHGLWSNSLAFKPMESDFDGNHYEAPQLKRMNYAATNDSSFSVNAPKVRDEVHGLLQQGADDGFAAGMIDLVGHSMGGVLGRLYLQGPDYADDVHRIVTNNTPHAGSQMADLLLDQNFDPQGLLCLLISPLVGQGHGCNNGAVADLSVESDATQKDLNEGTHPSDVAAHALVTVFDPDELPRTPLALLGPAVGVVAYVGLICGSNTIANAFNQDDHDLVVAATSQAGGLQSTHTSVYPQIWHVGSVAQPPVVDAVRSLLAEDETSTRFTTSGYSPERQFYVNPGLCTIGGGAGAAGAGASAGGTSRALAFGPAAEPSVVITAPTAGTTLAPGESFTVDVSGSADVATILIALGQQAEEIVLSQAVGPTASVPLDVPESAVGDIQLLAAAFDVSGALVAVSDPVVLDVAVPADLLAIDVYPPAVYLKPCGDASLEIRGAYDDGVTRDLSALAGLAFAFADGEATRSGAASVGLLGELPDVVTVSLGNVDSAAIPIRVLPTSEAAMACPEPGAAVAMWAGLATLGALARRRGAPVPATGDSRVAITVLKK